MMKFVLSGGRFALGFISGVIAAFFLLLSLNWSGARQLISGDISYVILGAVIAGFIGMAGQLLTILSSDAIEERRGKAVEKAGLLRSLQKTVSIYNTFIQVKMMGESEAIPDNVFIGTTPVSDFAQRLYH